MPTVNIVYPKTFRIQYRQEKGDKDYGSCLWANFDFDTKEYTLKIMSDCGNYSYGWVRTPKSESFVHLCKRLDWGYLLDKIAERSQIDEEATLNNAIDLIESEYIEDLPDGWKGELEDKIYSCRCEAEIAEHIGEFAEYYGITLEDYSIWQCIEKDYTANAKKIVEVYVNYIVPNLPEEARDD